MNEARLLELISPQFYSLINENSIVFVDFLADWCAPCKRFTTTFQKVSNQYPSVKFASVNIEEQKQLAQALSIQSIPHLIVFKEGVAIYSDAGIVPEDMLRELVNDALDFDATKIFEVLNNQASA